MHTFVAQPWPNLNRNSNSKQCKASQWHHLFLFKLQNRKKLHAPLKNLHILLNEFHFSTW